jgi:hypothetical protein
MYCMAVSRAGADVEVAMARLAGILVALITVAGPAVAEPVPKGYLPLVKRIDAEAIPVTVRRGETVVVCIHLDLKDRAFTLPATLPDDMQQVFGASRVTILADENVVPVGTLKEPAYRVREIPELDLKEFRYIDGSTVWERSLVVRRDAKPGEHVVKVKVWFHVMNDMCCVLPLKMELQAPLTISDEPAVAVDPKYAEAVEKARGRKPE